MHVWQPLCDVPSAHPQLVILCLSTSAHPASCLMYKLYMFLCDPPSDTSDVSIAELTSQVRVQLLVKCTLSAECCIDSLTATLLMRAN